MTPVETSSQEDLLKIGSTTFRSRQLLNLGSDVEEAARLSGARPFRVARDVSIPMVSPALLYVGVLVFFLEFFTGRGGGGPRIGGGGGGRVAEAEGISEHDKIMAYLGMPRLHGPEANFLKQKAKILWQGIKAAESGKGPTHSDPLSARQILGEIEIKVFRKSLSDQEREHRYH